VSVDDGAIDADTAPMDVEEFATDQVRAFIGERFTGHGLARLVEAVLQAQGLSTFRSPPGADGGVDVLVPRQATFARNEMSRSSSLSVCRLRQAM
jgi:predicted Mrr-cat superfamily restriction endonuclease